MAREDQVKKDMAEVMEKALTLNHWVVQRVDYRTLLVKVEQGYGGPKYYQVQVKEMY